MTDEAAKQELPDLTQGIESEQLPDGGRLIGYVGEDQVLLLRRGQEIFAIGAHCTHYHGPLAEGLVDGLTIRCPWHHACFDLRTGEALHAPAFSSVGNWSVEEREGRREQVARIWAVITPACVQCSKPAPPHGHLNRATITF